MCYFDQSKGENKMALNLFEDKGCPLDRQRFSWKDLVQPPISKLDDDAFTRIRVILMNGIEMEAIRFSHACARMNREFQLPLAQLRIIEHQQATMINGLLGADHSTLETTIAYEQVAIEITAAVAQNEPNEYLAQVYRFGMLEDFDHLYRYSAMLDRLEGKDANNILQCYTDIVPGRPTIVEHRAPQDNLREHYDRLRAMPITKLNALTIMSSEQQTQNFYLNVAPMYADPVVRQLYVEISCIEEQHVTQYESIIDPHETWLEKWMLHEANEVYNYYSCVQQEPNPRIKAIWERCLDYELGHLQVAMNMFKQYERRDPAEVLSGELPEPIKFESQREFVRRILNQEVDLRALGTQFVDKSQEGPESQQYRQQVNQSGSPTDTVSAGYVWHPGTELASDKELNREKNARVDEMAH